MKNELGSSNQEASPPSGKNTGLVLGLNSHTKRAPTAPTPISGGVDIFELPGCHLIWHMSSQLG